MLKISILSIGAFILH